MLQFYQWLYFVSTMIHRLFLPFLGRGECMHAENCHNEKDKVLYNSSLISICYIYGGVLQMVQCTGTFRNEYYNCALCCHKLITLNLVNDGNLISSLNTCFGLKKLKLCKTLAYSLNIEQHENMVLIKHIF